MLVLILIFRRPRRKGMRLRLLGGGPRAAADRTPSVIPKTPTYPPPRRPAAPRERSLNVVFNYNGESWDAFEVLGVPAGSNADVVRAAFTEALSTVDQSSRPFIEAAYRAILAQLDETA